MLKERRFCNMGFTAAAILHHMDDFKELLSKTKSTNLLVTACKLYTENSFILSCMKAFATFNYEFTYPFFMFSINATQFESVQLMPLLYHDLLNKKLDRLKSNEKYRVVYSFEVPELKKEIEIVLQDRFCEQVAGSLKTQKGREYGFDTSKKQRATDLTQLSEYELNGHPTDNMKCERQLGKVDHLLKRSATGSKNFEGYG